MKRIHSRARGFILLVVLAAAAVLSLIAAFIYSRTENQLLLSVSARGQSIASSRATLAAERKLAIYRAAYPGGLSILPTFADYATAVAANQTGDREFQNLDKALYPALDVSTGGGAHWCVESWLLNRGAGIPPWTVVEAFGFYGYTVQTAGIDFNHCVPQGNPRMISSHITLYLETPSSSSGCPTCSPCPACGTGTAGGS
jgi:hypothetical protein